MSVGDQGKVTVDGLCSVVGLFVQDKIKANDLGTQLIDPSQRNWSAAALLSPFRSADASHRR